MPTVRAVIAQLRQMDLDAECVLTEQDVARPCEYVALENVLADIEDEDEPGDEYDDGDEAASDDALDHARSLDDRDLAGVGADEEGEEW